MGIESVKGAAAATYQSAVETVTPRTEAVSQISMETAAQAGVSATGAMGAANESSKSSGGEDSRQVENAQIRKAVAEINKKANNTEVIWGIHDETNRVTIKIVDKDSKEIIREFPPEETLDMIAKVWEIAGLRVDEKL